MDLYDYFHKRKKEETNFSLGSFADQLGISKCYLSMVINGRGAPSIILAFRIEELTDGQVSFKDLMHWVYRNKQRILKRRNKKEKE